MTVRNLNGSGKQFPKPTCSCSTWLEHWENNRKWKDGKKRSAAVCRACGCKFEHSELNGGHVKKVESVEEMRYIVPLCDSCNGKDNLEFEVENSADLVAANTNECINK